MPSHDPASSDAFARDLCRFIGVSPSPFHAVESAVVRLRSAGFAEVPGDATWRLSPGGWFVRRGGSLVAFRLPDNALRRYRLIGAHTDSPNLRIKPLPDRSSAGIAQLGVEVYGGVLLNSWLDRDLGVSGRVVRRDNGQLREELFAVDEPVLRIPQLAIHLDRDVNERGLVLNKQAHLSPLWSSAGPDTPSFRSWLAGLVDCAPESIVGWDAMLHDTAPPAIVGVAREFVSSARIDNLLSCHAAVTALCAASTDSPDAQVVALFDHEEVGSTSDRGADGAFLGSVLERVSASQGLGRPEHLAALAASHCVSADCAHATHPNYPERHEPDHHIALNGGPVVKVNSSMRYASDASSAAPFLDACARAGTEVQWFVTRSDLACGSTIGPLTAGQLGIATVDVGVPQLAMHSIRELCGVHDATVFAEVLRTYLS
jgi:aspartyl aminopeptidase